MCSSVPAPFPNPAISPPQASSNTPGNLEAVKALIDHPAFVLTNPNSCYCLLLAFAWSPINFHAGGWWMGGVGGWVGGCMCVLGVPGTVH